MTLFESLIYAVVSAATPFLPLSTEAHVQLLQTLTGFTQPEPLVQGMFAFSGFIALLIHFRHDWASMLSSLIGVVFARKAPKTLDERIPLFVAVSWAPTLAAIFALRIWPQESLTSPLAAALGLAIAGLALFGSERWGRRHKNYWDWNLLDAFLIGLLAATSVLPGVGWITAFLIFGYLKNYRLNAIWKFALYGLLPQLGLIGIPAIRSVDFAANFPVEGVNWLTFALAIVANFAVSLMILNAITNSLITKTVGGFAVYRILMGIGVAGWLFFAAS